MTADRADLAFLGARRLAALARERQVSPVEITQLYLERITDPPVDASADEPVLVGLLALERTGEF
jgi:Asp-tRNA(Asn)/Glu-tRNA(Gln) amidotransferase A subunit family amidase